MVIRKISGWTLLTIGVLIIIWGIWTSFEIFTSQRPVYEVFKLPTTQEVSLRKETGGIEQVIIEQFKEMFPPDFLVKLLNLSAWWIFMMILMLGGGKLAALGITLLK